MHLLSVIWTPHGVRGCDGGDADDNDGDDGTEHERDVGREDGAHR